MVTSSPTWAVWEITNYRDDKVHGVIETLVDRFPSEIDAKVVAWALNFCSRLGTFRVGCEAERVN